MSNYNPTITLQMISNKLLCHKVYRKLLKTLSNPEDLSIELSFGDIAYCIGTHEAFQCLRALPDTVENRRFALGMIMPTVKRTIISTDDKRVHDCVVAMQSYIDGDDRIELRGMTKSVYADVAKAAYAAAFIGNHAFFDEMEQQKKEIIEASPLHYFNDNQ